MKLLYIAFVILLAILWYNYSGYMKRKDMFEDVVISKQQVLKQENKQVSDNIKPVLSEPTPIISKVLQQQVIYDKVQVSDNIKPVLSEPTPVIAKQNKMKKKMKINIEFQESKIEDISSYTADTGLVNAVHKESSEYILTPFQNSPKDIQTEVMDYLKREWYESNKKDENFSIDFIKTTWNDANNILYVLMQKNIQDSNLVRLIGTVAIDRKQFVPFFSQLFVVPHERNKGYADILIKHAEKYIKKMRFNKSKLWCKPELISFYSKLGYEVEDKKDEVYIMSKSI